MASSSTVNNRATAGQSIPQIAALFGLKTEDILALNPGLQPNSTMAQGQTYKLPASVAAPSTTAFSDYHKEFQARQAEAEKSKTKGKNGNP